MKVYEFIFRDLAGNKYTIQFFPEMNKALYVQCNNKLIFNNGYDYLIYDYDKPDYLNKKLEEDNLLELSKLISKLLDNKAFW